jgi:hypothetical protein
MLAQLCMLFWNTRAPHAAAQHKAQTQQQNVTVQTEPACCAETLVACCSSFYCTIMAGDDESHSKEPAGEFKHCDSESCNMRHP